MGLESGLGSWAGLALELALGLESGLGSDFKIIDRARARLRVRFRDDVKNHQLLRKNYGKKHQLLFAYSLF